jgi:hypothetical protein
VGNEPYSAGRFLVSFPFLFSFHFLLFSISKSAKKENIFLIGIINDEKGKPHVPENFSFIIKELNELAERGHTPLRRNGRDNSWRAMLLVMCFDYVEEAIMLNGKGHSSMYPSICDTFKGRAYDHVTPKSSIVILFFFPSKQLIKK